MNRSRSVKWVPDILRWPVHPAGPRRERLLGSGLMRHSCWVGATFPSGMWWQAHLGTPVVKKTNYPPTPTPPPPGVKVRAGRWDPHRSAVPDVYRRRTCCADYQVGNNWGCFGAFGAFWTLFVLEGYFSHIPKDFSMCLKESAAELCRGGKCFPEQFGC